MPKSKGRCDTLQEVQSRYPLGALTLRKYRTALARAYDIGYREARSNYLGDGWRSAATQLHEKLEQAVRTGEIDRRAAENLRREVLGDPEDVR